MKNRRRKKTVCKRKQRMAARSPPSLNFTTINDNKNKIQEKKNKNTLLLTKHLINNKSHFNQLLCFVYKSGAQHDPHTINQFLNFSTSSSKSFSSPNQRLQISQRLFSQIHNPNSSSYNLLIKHFSQTDHPFQALLLYVQMLEQQPILPNHLSLPFILKSCTQLKLFEPGKAIHGQAMKVGAEFDLYVQTGLFHFYSVSGNLDTRRVFDGMTQRSVVSWNALIAGYSVCGRMNDAREVFDEMDVEKSEASWNALIGGYVRNALHNEALMVLEEMKVVNHGRLSVLGTVSSLSACSNLGALEIGEWIHDYAKRRWLNDDDLSGLALDDDKYVTLGNALIDMYSKCGDVVKAYSVFEDLSIKNVVSWTAMIDGLAVHGKGKQALEVFNSMKMAMVKPNAITYVAVLRACSHGGLVDEGIHHFVEMQNVYRIIPLIEHYGCMVDLFCRVGMLDVACALVVDMPIEPDIVIWRSLLSGCHAHHNHVLGKLVAEQIKHFVRPGDDEEEGVRVLMSNMHAATKEWDGVSKVRRWMKKKGIKKTPGCSAIEVNHVVHEFMAGSKSHSRAEELKYVLESLFG